MNETREGRPPCPKCRAVEQVTCYKYRGQIPTEYICWACGAKYKPGPKSVAVFWCLSVEPLTIGEIGLLEQR